MLNNGLKCFFIVFAPDVETLHATSLRLTYKIHFLHIFAPHVETGHALSLLLTKKSSFFGCFFCALIPILNYFLL
jgi:hypothetical protein